MALAHCTLCIGGWDGCSMGTDAGLLGGNWGQGAARSATMAVPVSFRQQLCCCNLNRVLVSLCTCTTTLSCTLACCMQRSAHVLESCLFGAARQQAARLCCHVVALCAICVECAAGQLAWLPAASLVSSPLAAAVCSPCGSLACGLWQQSQRGLLTARLSPSLWLHACCLVLLCSA